MSEYLMGDIIQSFTLDQSVCTLCGVCIKGCDFDAISIIDDKLFFNPCRCRRCDGCETLCPIGAMKIEMKTVNMKPYSEKKVQERYWQINNSCHISCDGLCNDCQGVK